ncbi:MAG: ABC transporter permease, partial [Oscillospiraceae bacterium]|nr:ABC transporter permease [Oscillospiraceae bacterium]
AIAGPPVGALLMGSNINIGSMMNSADNGYADALVSVGGLDQETADNAASSGTSFYTWEEYSTRDEAGYEAYFAVTYVYAIIVIIVCMASSSQIITAVVQEKGSKLVDTLVLSVRPLALLLGKILAMISVVMATIICTVILFSLSTWVSGLFLDMGAVTGFISSAGLGDLLARLNFGAAAVLVISLLLACLICALMGGLSGACCSKMEESGNASMAVVLTVLAGYMVALFAPAFESSAFMCFSSLFPVLSMFCAPINYLMGDIGLGLLMVSWVIQALVIVFIARFTAGVYSTLLMHNGSRIKLKALIKLAGEGKAK